MSGVITGTAPTAGSGEPILNLISGNSKFIDNIKQAGVLGGLNNSF
jgi:hypothetical protein